MVLDPPNTSSSISSTSQTTSSSSSSSTGTTSGTASSSSSSSSGTQGPSSGSQRVSSGSQGISLTVERALAISMGIVGTLLAFLLFFLFWRCCIRRKGRNGENMDQITPQYHSVPIIPENGTDFPLNNNSMSIPDGAASHYGFGIQKYGSTILLLSPYSNSFFNSNDLYGPPVILGYDRGSSYSGLPSTSHMNQSASSLPLSLAQQIHHDPHYPLRPVSTLSMMNDNPPMYTANPESAPVSSSSNSNTNEKSRRSRTPVNALSFTAGAEPEVELTSTPIPGRREENVSVWDSGYPQPLRFVPIA